MFKKIALAAVLAGFALPAHADITEHSTHIACYASVHAQCYGDNGANCSDEDYQEGLDECDGYYEEGGSAEFNPFGPRPGGPGRLVAPGGARPFGLVVSPASPRTR